MLSGAFQRNLLLINFFGSPRDLFLVTPYNYVY